MSKIVATLLLTSGALIAVPAQALVQDPRPSTSTGTPPAPSHGQTPALPAAKVDDVVVTGRSDVVRSSIESTSYSLANDMTASTGVLADALRNIPSVDVDSQGNVSLRGDPDVTILVDGRPSGSLSGDARAQSVLSLPASRYSRVEVMTNPSAAYSPEGSGGVINLITRPVGTQAGSALTGGARVNAGNDGNWNAGLNGSRILGALVLSGEVSARHDGGLVEFDRRRQRLDPASGDAAQIIQQTADARSRVDSASIRLGGDYQVSDRVKATVEVRGNTVDNVSRGDEVYQVSSAGGAPLGRFDRTGSTRFQGDNLGVTGRLVTTMAGEGHDWSNELRLDQASGRSSRQSDYVYSLPAAAPAFEDVDNRWRLKLLGLTSAYARPLADGAKLRAGYELEVRDAEFANSAGLGPSREAIAPDPTVTNSFRFEQRIHAVYATYEKSWSDLSAQLGLRLEYADLDLDQVTSGDRISRDYFRAYPTLHLGYQLSETQQLKASYSRRIQRPPPPLLNPFVGYQDPLNRRSGNPGLDPQETDAFEVSWQSRAGPTFYQATAYLRNTDKAFTEVSTDIGGGVLLTRPENLGGRRDVGLEAVANGSLGATLRYSSSLNIYRQEIDALDLVGGGKRSANVLSGRLSLNWSPTAKDYLQVAAIWQGEQLLAQGSRRASELVNLGYRRKITETLSFQLTVRDLLNSFGDVSQIQSPQFRDRIERRSGGRSWFAGFTYAFGQSGARRAQEPQFDFSAAPSGS